MTTAALFVPATWLAAPRVRDLRVFDVLSPIPPGSSIAASRRLRRRRATPRSGRVRGARHPRLLEFFLL